MNKNSLAHRGRHSAKAKRNAYDSIKWINRNARVKVFAVADNIAKGCGFKLEPQKTMWVAKGKTRSKKLAPLERGTQVVNYKEYKKRANRGEQFRTINYIADKTLRREFGKLASAIDQSIIANDILYGFTRGKAVQTLMSTYCDKRSVLELDLKDAFHQMTRTDIYYILHITLDLNRKLANWLADWGSVNGVAAMGCPYIPTLFNIWMLERLERFNQLFGHNGTVICSYADDITIFSDEEKIAWKRKALWIKFLKRQGFRFNETKSRFQHNNGGIVKLGLTIYRKRLYVHKYRDYRRKMKKIRPTSRHNVARAWGLLNWAISEANRVSTAKRNMRQKKEYIANTTDWKCLLQLNSKDFINL